MNRTFRKKVVVVSFIGLCLCGLYHTSRGTPPSKTCALNTKSRLALFLYLFPHHPLAARRPNYTTYTRQTNTKHKQWEIERQRRRRAREQTLPEAMGATVNGGGEC